MLREPQLEVNLDRRDPNRSMPANSERPEPYEAARGKILLALPLSEALWAGQFCSGDVLRRWVRIQSALTLARMKGGAGPAGKWP